MDRPFCIIQILTVTLKRVKVKVRNVIDRNENASTWYVAANMNPFLPSVGIGILLSV